MFQIFSDSNGRSISLTSTHLLNVLERGYVSAGSIHVGERLRVYSAERHAFDELKVERIEFDMKTGFSAPLTQAGTILVNGVDSSCYAQVNSHFLADLSMAPLKIWSRLRKLLSINNNNNNRHHVEVGAYSSALYRLASLFFSSYLI